jgi:hypothetical protein
MSTPPRPGSAAWRARYGPWAVVTGASDGIGRAFAEALAARGLHLVLVARRAEVLRDLADALHAAHGVQVIPWPADLADRGAAAALAARTAELDVGLLVAAAGFGTSGAFLRNPLEHELGMLDVNCGAVTALAWHYGRRFAARRRGGLVLLSSVLAFQGTPRAAHYAATKAYIQTLAEGLRGEWTAHGVDVIASAPGPIASGFAARADLRMPNALPPTVVARGTLAALGRRATTRPGWLSKLLGWSLATAPRPLRVRIITGVMLGMTAHQRPNG